MTQSFQLTEPVDRMLLLMARPDWTVEQRRLAVTLAEQIGSWESLLERAGAHFILPLAHRHLQSLPLETIPGQLSGPLREHLKQTTIQTLNVSLAQRHLIDRVLQTGGKPFLILKGKALAGRYYPSPSLRVCRDVDVLVAQRTMFKLAQRLRDFGYIPWPSPEISDQDLKASIRFEPEISLMSPEGVLIEIHKQLDKSGQIFKTRAVLARRETDRIDGISVPVPSTADHFVFICLHHARHLWSHLHWLTDLDAIQRSTDFDRERVQRVASACGITGTVEAAVAMQECATELAMTGQTRTDGHAADFLQACVHHLRQGPSAEFELRKARPFSDFAFDWQARDHSVFGNALRRKLWTLKPRMIDYQTMPLPSGLHWLYNFTRPFTGVGRRIKRLLNQSD